VQLQIFKFLYLRGGLVMFLCMQREKLPDTAPIRWWVTIVFIAKPFDHKWSPFVFLGKRRSARHELENLGFHSALSLWRGCARPPSKPGMLLEITAAYNLTNSDDLDNIFRAMAMNCGLPETSRMLFIRFSVGLSYYIMPGPQERKPAPVQRLNLSLSLHPKARPGSGYSSSATPKWSLLSHRPEGFG
jgi:hypothetical protein